MNEQVQALRRRADELQARMAESARTVESLHQEALLFELSLGMLCVAGTDGYFKLLNPAFERTLGYTRQELLSRPFIEFVHPEDRRSTREELDRLSRGVPTVHFENRYCRKDGGYRWLAWTAMPRPDEGLIYATATDITAHRRADERFRRLLESAPDGMVVVDRQGKITLVNAQAEAMFGYSRQELIGQSVEILVPARLRDAHAQQREAFAGRPQLRTMGSRPDLLARRKDGSEFLAEISLSPIETEEGLLVASAIRDVTERRRAERALRDNQVQLLAAQRIQEFLLPRSPPALPGFDVAGACYPAEFAAGDHFDFLSMPGETWGIVVGDVSGHGFSTALLMAVTHAYLRALSGMCRELEDVLARTNQALVEETEENRFVTLFFGRLNPRTHTLSYVSAGHPTGYVLSASGEVRHRLASNTLPLGVQLETAFPEVGPVALEPGDLVLLVTDGVLEASPPDHEEEFGPQRLLETVRAHRALPAADILDAIYAAVRSFSGDGYQPDDITMVVVKVADE